MAKIKGITITLYEKTETGVDSFGAPIYEETPVTIDNVIVVPTSGTDVVDATALYGKKAVYTLGIPKGDAHEWKDAKVEFFGETFRVFGAITQGIEDLIPLDWNKKAYCEAYEI